MKKKSLIILCASILCLGAFSSLAFYSQNVFKNGADVNEKSITFNTTNNKWMYSGRASNDSINAKIDNSSNIVPFSYTQSVDIPSNYFAYWKAGGTLFNTEEVRSITKIEILGGCLAAFNLEYGYEKVGGNINYTKTINDAFTFTELDADTTTNPKVYDLSSLTPNYIRLTQTGTYPGDTNGGRGVRAIKIYFLASCVRGKEPTPTPTFDIHNKDYMLYLGRHHTTSNNGEYFSHSNSGFSLDITVTSATNSIKGSFTGSTHQVSETIQYAKTFIDTTLIDKINIPNGTNEIEIFKNIGVGEHTIEFKKCNEFQFAQLTLNSLTISDGITVKKHVETRPLIEFYGDSITCGYGNLTDSSHSFELKTEDSTLAYTQLTANQLSYRCSSVSVSGVALAKSPWGGSITMMDYYKKDGPDTIWDSSKDIPAISIINLGTNDNTSYQNASTQAEKDSIISTFYTNLKTMCEYILGVSNKTKIILCYEMMVYLAQGFKDSFDQVISYFALQGITIYKLGFTPNTGGADGHPSAAAHQTNANQLVTFINSL